MNDVIVNPEDLKASSTRLNDAADVAETAREDVSGMSIPLDEGVPNPVGEDFIGEPLNAFGRPLGLAGVAAAYEQHREKIAEVLWRLQQNTETMSTALSQIAELYEDKEAEMSSRFGRLNAELDEI